MMAARPPIPRLVTAVVVAGAVVLQFGVVPRLASTLTPASRIVVVPTLPTPSIEVPTRDLPDPEPSTSSEPAETAGDVGTLAIGVVLIESTLPRGKGSGTGMVLTSGGQVLTNYHVVAGSTEVEVTVATTGATYAASVLGHDAVRDVALLQLEGASGLATVRLDDDSDAQVGAKVTAVGNAGGQGFLSDAVGSIVDLDATLRVKDDNDPTQTSTLTGMIETTAGAVPGDSGGPMLDGEGEVLGMTTAGTQAVSQRTGTASTSVTYMVPIETAVAIVNQVRSGQEAGTVEVGPRSYLGITLGGTTRVSSVVSGGPAAKGGLAAGDVITAIGSTAVTTPAQLRAALGALEPGSVVRIAWTTTAGVKKSGQVTLASNPQN